MTKNAIHILLVDDHRLFRRALMNLIVSFDLGSVLHEAANGNEALTILSDNHIDLVLLDIQMPEMGGIEVMKRIRDLSPNTRVVVLTQFDERSLITYLTQLNVNGFLLKQCDPVELKNAIVTVVRDGYYYNELVPAKLENIAKKKSAVNLGISPREFQLMGLLKDGKSNKEISKDLSLTLRTVESYRKALMKKTKCRNVAEMVSLAYRTGIFHH